MPRLSEPLATAIVLLALVTVMLSIAMSAWTILVAALCTLVTVAIIVHEGADGED